MHFRINQGQAEVVRRLPDDNRDRHGFLFLLPNPNVDSRLEVKAILPRDEEMSFLPSPRGKFADKFLPPSTSTSALAPLSRLGHKGRGTFLCGFGFGFGFERMSLFRACSREGRWKDHERRSLRIRLPTPKAALAPVVLPTAVLHELAMENKALARLAVGDVVSKATLGISAFPCFLQCDGTDSDSHSAL